MKTLKHLTLACLSIVSLYAFAQLTPVQTEEEKNPQIDKARQFFAIVTAFYNSYDPQLTHLYSDNAIVKMIRLYPDGQTQELTIEGIRIKETLKVSLQRARMLRETIRFSDINYTDEGDMVRINATLHNELKNYTAPYELLIGKSGDGTWRIFAETIQSQP